jgi:Predicted membrane protein (DUF2207)
MRANKLSLNAAFLVCGMLLCGRIAKTNTPDRIVTFDSKITINIDRTLHVVERFAIVNDTGAFDNGLHRRLRVAPVSPQRLKAGSFESVAAKVDGHDALLRTEVDKEVFHIEIVTVTGALPRGNHVIDLSYTAKNQFAIFHNSEDLNRNITGDWPVSIDKATVELHFPAKLPDDAGVSADTGTDSRFQFDCVRTNLPLGMRFETTHSLSPGNSLFISARFPRSNYFVSNVKEEGYRTIRENHPFLIPSVVSVCGSIVLAVAGFVVWRRAPRSVDTNAAVPDDSNLRRSFWREVIRIYRFPTIMFLLAIVPGLNFTYSGHGGLSWFLVPLCFPWVIVKILIKIAREPEPSRSWYKSFFKITIPSYIAIALPLSWLAATSIRMAFGLEISTWSFFALMVSPFPWWYFT